MLLQLQTQTPEALSSVNSVTTEILLNVVLLVISTVGVFAVRYLKAKFTPAQIAAAEEVAGIAVHAVEQVAVKRGWDANTKLAEAQVVVNDLGAKYGVTLSDEQWRALIEAAVASMRAAGEDLTSTAEPIS